jgi:hypothetical protein
MPRRAIFPLALAIACAATSAFADYEAGLADDVRRQCRLD